MRSAAPYAVSHILFCSPLLTFLSLNAMAASRGLTVSRVAVDPTNSNTVYAASNQGLFKSLDAGSSWFEINTGLPPHPSIDELDQSFADTLDVRGFAIDPRNPEVLYAGVRGAYARLVDGTFIEVAGGTFKSTDGGQRWIVFGEQGGQFRPSDLIVDPVDSDTVYGAAGLFIKTTTGGADWLTRRIPGQFGPAESIILNPRDSNTLYLGLTVTSDLDEHAIFKTINGGKDWINTGLPRGRASIAPALAIDPRSPDTLFATFFQYAGATGTYKSTDGGESWSHLTQLGNHCVIIDPNDPDTLYVCERNGVAKSTDGGSTWYLYQAGLEKGFRLVNSLAIDPNDSSTLYAGTFPEKGVFKSVDGGASWFELGP